jgi:hypothetical protein
LLGQVFVCPHHGAKTGAVGEAQLREIQHEDLRAVVIQHCADSPAQTVEGNPVRRWGLFAQWAAAGEPSADDACSVGRWSNCQDLWIKIV